MNKICYFLLSSWKIRYLDASSSVWKDAFTRTSAIREGWNEKAFLVNASKIRFYFTGSGDQLTVNEIQCFREYLAPEQTSIGPVSCLLIEPEDCSDLPLFDPFYVASDEDACNGSYINSDIDGDMDTPSETGRVVIDFKVDTAATFYVYLRALATSGTDDSFWILMDGEPTKFNGIEISSDWIWVQTPQFYELNEGEHTLEIVRRESNTRLDQVLITTSTISPVDCADCPNRYDPGLTSAESIKKLNKPGPEKQLFLYPNPTQSFVNIEFQYPDEGILEIYSPQGSILKSMKIKNDSIIDINDLQSGYYLCVLKTQRNEYLSSDLLIIGR